MVFIGGGIMYIKLEDVTDLAKVNYTIIKGSGRCYGKTWELNHNKPFNKVETRFIKKTITNLERALLKVRRKLCMSQYNMIKSTINILKESIGE